MDSETRATNEKRWPLPSTDECIGALNQVAKLAEKCDLNPVFCRAIDECVRRARVYDNLISVLKDWRDRAADSCVCDDLPECSCGAMTGIEDTMYVLCACRED